MTHMLQVYYKHAVGAFVVVDLTAEQPLLNVAAWKNDLDFKTSHNDGTILPAVLLASTNANALWHMYST